MRLYHKEQFAMGAGPCWQLVGLIVLAGIVMTQTVLADDVRIDVLQAWSNVFAESESKWTFRIQTDSEWNGDVHWQVSILQRRVASGERQVAATRDKPAEISHSMRWPDVKDGTVTQAELRFVAGQAEISKAIWIFPRDPFAGRSEWVKNLKLSVFDPAGETCEKLESLAVPFARVRSLNALTDLDNGLLIVGEQIEFEKHADLMDSLLAVARKGVPVLCLASASGQLNWPQDDASILGIQLRRSDVVRDLDKRLDFMAWAPGRSPQVAGLRILAKRDAVVAEVSDESSAWPWCELMVRGSTQAEQRSTQVIWVGFGLNKVWDESPTPRYLLSRLLERLADSVPR